MVTFQNAEEERYWTNLANTHVSHQKKMRHDRVRLRKRLALLERQLADARAENRHDDVAFFTISRRLLENLDKSLDLFDINGHIMEVPEPAAIGAAEWYSLTAQILMLQLDGLKLGRLHALLTADHEAALAGEPIEIPCPRLWLKVRDRLRADSDWRAAIYTFLKDYPPFNEAVAKAALEFEKMGELPPGRPRLNQAKELNLPTLKGQHYRLEALFRRLSQGTDLLDSMRAQAHEYPEGEPSQVIRKRTLTDKLLNFFNPTP